MLNEIILSLAGNSTIKHLVLNGSNTIDIVPTSEEMIEAIGSIDSLTGLSVNLPVMQFVKGVLALSRSIDNLQVSVTAFFIF